MLLILLDIKTPLSKVGGFLNIYSVVKYYQHIIHRQNSTVTLSHPGNLRVETNVKVSAATLCILTKVKVFCRNFHLIINIINKKAFVGLGNFDNVQTERKIFKYANWPRLQIKRTGPSSWSLKLVCPRPAGPSSWSVQLVCLAGPSSWSV